MLCDDLQWWDGGGWEAQVGRDTSMLIANLLCRIVETDGTVKQLYSNILIKKIKAGIIMTFTFDPVILR